MECPFFKGDTKVILLRILFLLGATSASVNDFPASGGFRSSSLRNSDTLRSNSATSGERIKLQQVRVFDKGRLDQYDPDSSVRAFGNEEKNCTIWAVTTTISPPGEALQLLAATRDFCLCVVLDRKSPIPYNLAGGSNNVVILTPEDQELLPLRTAKLLPWNSFGRKNLGYLYAVAHGGGMIFDFDDDNIVKDIEAVKRFLGVLTVRKVSCTSKVYNVYRDFGLHWVWPRGFPLDKVKVGKHSVEVCYEKGWYNVTAAVLQSLADVDPDLDAIFRLTQKFPLFFHHTQPTSPWPGTYTPFNAQATIFTREAFYGMFLPITVHGRVSDIWRSYILQRVFKETRQSLVFTAPFVYQYRNAHDYLADFQSELTLYEKSGVLVDLLDEMKILSDRTPIEMVQDIMVHLYNYGVIEEADVVLSTAFLHDLLDLQYPSAFASGVQMLPAQIEPAQEWSVAICAVGQLRAGLTNLWHIKHKILDALANYRKDVFVVTSGVKNISAVLQYLDPTVVVDDRRQTGFEASWAEMKSKYQNKHRRYVTAGLQLFDWYICSEEILAKELQMKSKYTHIMKLRLDYFPASVYVMPQPEEDVAIYLPDFHHCGGVNDRFAFGGRSAMLVYLRLVTAVKHVMKRKTKHKMNLESIVKANLLEHNISIVKRKEWTYCMLPKDHNHPGKFRDKQPEYCNPGNWWKFVNPVITH